MYVVATVSLICSKAFMIVQTPAVNKDDESGKFVEMMVFDEKL